MSESNEDRLTRWASMAMREFARERPAERAEAVAITAGRQASRLGMTVPEMNRWLQSAYGSVFVRLGNLDPGMDLKRVWKYMLQGYSAGIRR